MNVVAIGGSIRAQSSTHVLLEHVCEALRAEGMRTELFAGPALVFPPYAPDSPLPAQARRMVESVRAADAVLVGSPGYHGAPSGLVKNALDYLEALREDARPYLSGRPVGLIVTADGWQAAVSTLLTLRQVVHALRGWPTPLGIAVNLGDLPQGIDGGLTDATLLDRLTEMTRQLTSFCTAFARSGAGERA